MDDEKDDKHTKFPLNDGRITVETFDEKHYQICIGRTCEKVTHEELYSLLFFFGTEQQQEDLIPVKQTEVMSLSRLLTITAKKDIKRGETIKVWYDYFLPTSVATKLIIQNPERYRPANLSTDKLLKDVNKIV